MGSDPQSHCGRDHHHALFVHSVYFEASDKKDDQAARTQHGRVPEPPVRHLLAHDLLDPQGLPILDDRDSDIVRPHHQPHAVPQAARHHLEQHLPLHFQARPVRHTDWLFRYFSARIDRELRYPRPRPLRRKIHRQPTELHLQQHGQVQKARSQDASADPSSQSLPRRLLHHCDDL